VIAFTIKLKTTSYLGFKNGGYLFLSITFPKLILNLSLNPPDVHLCAVGNSTFYLSSQKLKFLDPTLEVSSSLSIVWPSNHQDGTYRKCALYFGGRNLTRLGIADFQVVPVVSLTS